MSEAPVTAEIVVPQDVSTDPGVTAQSLPTRRSLRDATGPLVMTDSPTTATILESVAATDSDDPGTPAADGGLLAASAALLNRRGLLLAGIGGAAATATAGTLLLSGGADPVTGVTTAGATASGPGGTTTASSKVAAGPTPKPAATKQGGFFLPADLDPVLLISRATYGRTATLERQVHESTPTKWLAAQLKPGVIKDPGGAAILKRYPRLGWSTSKVRASLKDGDGAVMNDLVAAHVSRAAWSNRQLFEVMVDFWSNHFNVTVPSDGVWDSRHRYDADVIRANALGSFEKMLLASAFHPSMLIYLNNAESTKDAPNENYARELLELHTVGVDGGYTEGDVKKGALLLTGWTVMNGKAGYDRTRHYVGKLKVFGFSTPNTSATGKESQRAYLSYLARHPKTAHYIASKLAQRFVSDTPPADLVQRLAKVYLASKTQIVPVLRAIFASPEFAASSGQKVRRPMEVLAASIRVLGIQPGADSQGLMDLVWMLDGMSHKPLNWSQPNGYGDVASDWQSPAAALAQFNSAASLVHGWWPTKLNNPTATKLLSSPGRTRDSIIDAVGKKLFGRKPTAKEKQAAKTLLSGTSLPATFGNKTYQQQETIALVATLFLQSPAHLTR